MGHKPPFPRPQGDFQDVNTYGTNCNIKASNYRNTLLLLSSNLGNPWSVLIGRESHIYQTWVVPIDKAVSPIEAGSTLFYCHISINQQTIEILKYMDRQIWDGQQALGNCRELGMCEWFMKNMLWIPWRIYIYIYIWSHVKILICRQ